MANKIGKYNAQELTKFLKSVAAEETSCADDGELITNAEQLARKLWQLALGYEEMVVVNGVAVTKVHKPASWAMQFIIERCDGKVPTTLSHQTNQMTAADRVGDLAAAELNRMASEVVAAKPGPPPIGNAPSD